MLLDSDDYLLPHAVEICVREFPAGCLRVYFRLMLVEAMDRPIPAGLHNDYFEKFDGYVFERAARGKPLYLGPPISGNFFDAMILKLITPIPEENCRICADVYVAIKAGLCGLYETLTGCWVHTGFIEPTRFVQTLFAR